MQWPDALRGPRALFLPAGAVMAVHLYFHFGPGWTFLAAVGFVWTLIALAAIDIERHLLPDRITLPLLWAGLAVNLQGNTFTTLENAVIGAMVGYLSLWLIYHAHRILTGREGMGYGDFKMLAAIGAWLGWAMLPLVFLSAVVVHLVLVSVLTVSGKLERHTPVPFGPSLLIGAWLTLLWGKTLSFRLVINLGGV
ncbi:MAG: prepilin peptidase [Gammaproteobacteria bacterium]|nr:prepilin peptidase [Gammaproteobacteria bacterium]MYG68382.1 prepilin peptidase [Gammaproteobacteria bacterium]